MGPLSRFSSWRGTASPRRSTRSRMVKVWINFAAPKGSLLAAELACSFRGQRSAASSRDLVASSSRRHRDQCPRSARLQFQAAGGARGLPRCDQIDFLRQLVDGGVEDSGFGWLRFARRELVGHGQDPVISRRSRRGLPAVMIHSRERFDFVSSRSAAPGQRSGDRVARLTSRRCPDRLRLSWMAEALRSVR